MVEDSIPPIEITYSFTYHNVTASQAEQNNSADLAYTRNLLDSAKYSYSLKQL